MDIINLISIGIIGLVGYQVANTSNLNSNLKAIVTININKINGTVKFEQIDISTVTIEIDLDGFEPNSSHGFHVHMKSVKSGESCDLAGPHFDIDSSPHGGPFDSHKSRHVGDLGNILADGAGRVKTKFSDYLIRLNGSKSIIGRSLIIHDKPDDFKTIESSGKRLVCEEIKAI